MNPTTIQKQKIRKQVEQFLVQKFLSQIFSPEKISAIAQLTLDKLEQAKTEREVRQIIPELEKEFKEVHEIVESESREQSENVRAEIEAYLKPRLSKLVLTNPKLVSQICERLKSKTVTLEEIKRDFPELEMWIFGA